MSGDERRLTAEERDRVDRAKKRGGLCAGCGRALVAAEPVYIERFWIGTKLFRDPGARGARVYVAAPVGVECASAEFLREAESAQPEPCAGCGRGVYYRVPNPRRRRAACCQRCRARAGRAERAREG